MCIRDRANYALGLFMDGVSGLGRRKFILIAGILVNLGILGYYKYFNFFINTLNKIFGRELLSMKDIALPLGVSFFTFQAMTYLIDLYKKKYPAQKNVLNKMCIRDSPLPVRMEVPVPFRIDAAYHDLCRKPGLCVRSSCGKYAGCTWNDHRR